MVVDTQTKRHAAKVVRALRTAYPDAACALRHRSAYELLVATILSAQCTDKQVNLVTKKLFAKYATPGELARAPLAALERDIKSTGFFRNKARNIKACCEALVERYDGQVPRQMDLLTELPGVGRKTANVVLGTAYGLATGVVVDTHVARVGARLGLTQANDPEKIERDLMERLPRKEWIGFSHRVIRHGRSLCKARRPLCEECSLSEFCPRIGVAS
jgi:endonuclease-3